MAVYTHIDKTTLDDFLSKFDIGPSLSYQGITEGVENSNYVFETRQGKFILTIFEKRVNAEELPFYIGFMEHLQKSGIPCPAVIRNKAGKFSGSIQNKPAIIASFLPGVWPKEITAQHCRAVGRVLAGMHEAAAGFTMKRHNALALPGWRSLIHACRDQADTLEKGLFAFLDAELNYLEKKAPKNMPKGAVHADLFPDNVFFEGDNLSGVIDFYFACTEVFVYDLMLVVNPWCFDKKGNFDREKYETLMKSYTSLRPLSKREITSLPYYGRAAAMRIIATRLYDWLNPVDGALIKPKDPMEHVRILRYHQNICTGEEYGAIA
jgi:homoserine kinase type II